MNKKKKAQGSRLAASIMLFFFLSFLLLALHSGSVQGYVLSVAVPGVILVSVFILPRLFRTDPFLLTLTSFLCAVGILLMYAMDPACAFQQMVFYGLGMAAMICCIYLVRMIRFRNHRMMIPMLLSLLFLALPLLVGKEKDGTKSWIDLGLLSFQPGDLLKPMLVLVAAYYLSDHRTLPWLLFTLGCVLVLMLQHDPGTALIYLCTVLLLYWACTGNLIFSLSGLLLGCGVFWYGYRFFEHIRPGVSDWLKVISAESLSDKMTDRGISAIAEGGLWGAGLGLSSPSAFPAYESGYAFAVLCHQFGLIFSLCVLLIFAVLIWRGTEIAMEARHSFHGLLALGSVIMTGLQAFINVGGVIRLIPPAGVSMPFLSYGGSSLIPCLCLIGLIQGAGSLNEDSVDEEIRLGLFERSEE